MPKGRSRDELIKIGKNTRFGTERGCNAAEAGAKGNAAIAANKTIRGFLEEGLDKKKIADVLAKRGYSGNLKAIQMILDLLGESGSSGLADVQQVVDDPLTKAMEEMGEDVLTEAEENT